MSSTWQPLPLTAGLQGSSALLKYRLSSEGVQVHVSDLSQVWSEDLSKADVCERAITTGCYINPSEDESQYTILLQKIESALCGHDQTQTELGVDGAEHLILKITTPLPEPLPALTWEFRLGPGSREQVISEVLTPLICSTYMRKQQTDDLVSLITHKDNLISKMIEKLESLGSDLASLFPTLGKLPKRKNQRVQLSQYVKGLGPFDESSWRADFDSKVHNNGGDVVRDMNRVAFGESGTEAVRGLIRLLPEHASEPLPDRLRIGRVKKPSLRNEETRDEFQHQITPKKLRSKRARVDTDERDDDDETTEGTRTVSPTPNPRSARSSFRDTSPSKSGPSSAKRLGKITGFRRAVRTEDVQLTDTPKKSTQPSHTNTVEMEMLGGEQNQAPKDRVSTSRKLGRIGGGSTSSVKPSTIQEIDPVDVAQDQKRGVSQVREISQTAQPRTPRKLGRIGGRRSSSTQEGTSQGGISAIRHTIEMNAEERQRRDESVAIASVAQTPSPTPPIQQPAEDAEEKAKRRRLELEREMSKDRTPTKKRRRF